MQLTLWRRYLVKLRTNGVKSSIPVSVPIQDTRAKRYFSKAAQYNAAAVELGYESFEAALQAGHLMEIVRKAEADSFAEGH